MLLLLLLQQQHLCKQQQWYFISLAPQKPDSLGVFAQPGSKIQVCAKYLQAGGGLLLFSL